MPGEISFHSFSEVIGLCILLVGVSLWFIRFQISNLSKIMENYIKHVSDRVERSEKNMDTAISQLRNHLDNKLEAHADRLEERQKDFKNTIDTSIKNLHDNDQKHISEMSAIREKIHKNERELLEYKLDLERNKKKDV